MKNPYYFFHPEDLPIADLEQIYMMCSLWHKSGMQDVWGTFDLLVRDMPAHRNFLVFSGLQEMLTGIMRWSFSTEHLRILKTMNVISSSFGTYLRNFYFTGDVHAMREGTFFFPGEPIVRIHAPLIEANLLTAFLLTSLTSNTPFASKFIRVVIAARGISVVGPGPQRAQGFESAYKAARAAYMVGSRQVPLYTRYRQKIPSKDPTTIAYHAFIKSYETELQAMQVAVDHAYSDLSLMIDTYDIRRGLQNAIALAPRVKKRGLSLKIVIDSGDLWRLSKYVRRELNRHGLRDVRIGVASNLNEYKIDRLVKRKASVDSYLVATEAVTSFDAPSLEAVYKIAELETERGREYKMKLAKGKVSLPGRKQVYRVFRGNSMVHDVIGLERESGIGSALLRPMIRNGKLIYSLPDIEKIRRYVFQQLPTLPRKYLDIHHQYVYPVQHSKKLRDLMRTVRDQELAQYKNTPGQLPGVLKLN